MLHIFLRKYYIVVIGDEIVPHINKILTSYIRDPAPLK